MKLDRSRIKGPTTSCHLSSLLGVKGGEKSTTKLMLACPDQGGLNFRFERVDFHETTTDGHYVLRTIAMERETGLLTQSMLEFLSALQTTRHHLGSDRQSQVLSPVEVPHT